MTWPLGNSATAFGAPRRDQLLFRSALLAIADISHREHDCDSDIDVSSTWHQLLLTRSGAALARRVDGRQSDIIADPVQAVLLESGSKYSMRHPMRTAHAYTTFAFAPSVLPEDQRVNVCKRHLVRGEVLLRYHRLRQRLLGPAGHCADSALATEEEAIALLHSATGSEQVGQKGTARRHRDLAESAKLILASAPGAAHRLEDVASSLGVSPSHLAHVFRAVVGLPVHQYLLQIRMAIAVDHLSNGADNLSELALTLGFVSHSHFTAAFRQCFGVPPSSARCAFSATSRSDAQARAPQSLLVGTTLAPLRSEHPLSRAS